MMVSTVNTGSINMPKLLRHMSHRTSNVREVVFQRDAIFNKSTKTTGATSGTEGTGTALSGPAVNFGYETSTNTTIDGSASDTVYHLTTPALTIGGLKVLQTPVISRSGKLERTGARISGECKFYTPSLSTIRQLDNFSETTQFDEFEAYDKFIDIERAVYTPSDISSTNDQTITISSGSTYNPGYTVDRIRFKIKTADNLTSITLNGKEGGADKSLVWTVTDTFAPSDWVIIDLPIRDIGAATDTEEVWVNGVNYTLTPSTRTLDVDKLYGDSNNYLSSLVIATSSSSTIELKDINIYKSAEWSLESIKDYRDEYMIIEAVRVRGDRTSRRRAHG
jgi:hypothetical protein